MAYRSRMSRRSSRRNFGRGTLTHKKNLGMNMRGGIRL